MKYVIGFFVIIFFMFLAGCSTLRPCMNVATQSTLWQVGLTSNTDNHACNDGIDDDYLQPDIYTPIMNA